MITYTWTVQTLDEKTGSLINERISRDCPHLSALDSPRPGTVTRIGLVRNTETEWGVINAMWAFVKDGRLPLQFSDSDNQASGCFIPHEFRSELEHMKG